MKNKNVETESNAKLETKKALPKKSAKTKSKPAIEVLQTVGNVVLEEKKYPRFLDFYKEYLNEIINSDLLDSDKVKELINFKTIILFELTHGEVHAAYVELEEKIGNVNLTAKAAEKNRKEFEVLENPIDNFLIDFSNITKYVFNDKYAWQELLEATEFALYEITAIGGTSKPTALKDNENNYKSCFEVSALVLLFKQLREKGILSADAVKMGFGLHTLTGYSPNTTRGAFSKILTKKRHDISKDAEGNEIKEKVNSFKDADIKAVIEKLNTIIDDLEKYSIKE